MSDKKQKDMPVKAKLELRTLNILDEVCKKRGRTRNFIMKEVLTQWAFQDKWHGRVIITDEEEYSEDALTVKLDGDTIQKLNESRWKRKRSMSYIINEIMTLWAMKIKDEIPNMVPD